MNCWEYKYIEEFQRAGKLIIEQQTSEFNPLLAIAQKRKEMTVRTSQTSAVQQQPSQGGYAESTQNITSTTGKRIKHASWAPYINKLTLITNQFQLLLTGMLPQT